MPEICLDEWTITYTEFQPQKNKQAKKRTSEDTLVKEIAPLGNLLARLVTIATKRDIS
jgi:hypothetical protein